MTEVAAKRIQPAKIGLSVTNDTRPIAEVLPLTGAERGGACCPPLDELERQRDIALVSAPTDPLDDEIDGEVGHLPRLLIDAGERDSGKLSQIRVVEARDPIVDTGSQTEVSEKSNGLKCDEVIVADQTEALTVLFDDPGTELSKRFLSAIEEGRLSAHLLHRSPIARKARRR